MTKAQPTMIPITQALIERGQSDAGGWNRPQLALLGVPWPPLYGWRRRVDGTLITQEEAESFVRLRGLTKRLLKATKREQAKRLAL